MVHKFLYATGTLQLLLMYETDKIIYSKATDLVRQIDQQNIRTNRLEIHFGSYFYQTQHSQSQNQNQKNTETEKEANNSEVIYEFIDTKKAGEKKNNAFSANNLELCNNYYK